MKPHIKQLVANGVINVDSKGVIRLTREAWKQATDGTKYAEPAIHFVGFRDDRYWNAVKTFGKPDFIHRFFDQRAVAEFASTDIVIFADGDETQTIKEFAYDDSAYF